MIGQDPRFQAPLDNGAVRLTIAIVGMTTWGELGNWLSANTLAHALHRLGHRTTVIRAEELYPDFAEIGGSIRSLVVSSNTTGSVRTGYAELMSLWDRRLTDGWLGMTNADWHTMSAKLAIDNGDPQVLIGTKGVISRLLCHVRDRSARSSVVANYVTNHGHFQFSIHHCRCVARHWVRLSSATAFLRNQLGITTPCDMIGYLLPEMPAWVADQKADHGSGLTVVALGNRAPIALLDCLRSVATWEQADVRQHIVLLDRGLDRLVREVLGGIPLVIHGRLAPDEYGAFLARFRGSNGLFISKASPNAVFEALRVGLTPCLYPSGLPMEDWAAELVSEHGLGYVAEDLRSLSQWLLDSANVRRTIEQSHAARARFVSNTLDQQMALTRLREAVDKLHSGVAAGEQ